MCQQFICNVRSNETRSTCDENCLLHRRALLPECLDARLFPISRSSAMAGRCSKKNALSENPYSTFADRRSGTSFCTLESNTFRRKVTDKAYCKTIFKIGG